MIFNQVLATSGEEEEAAQNTCDVDCSIGEALNFSDHVPTGPFLVVGHAYGQADEIMCVAAFSEPIVIAGFAVFSPDEMEEYLFTYSQGALGNIGDNTIELYDDEYTLSSLAIIGGTVIEF